jgi:hypothetical protein
VSILYADASAAAALLRKRSLEDSLRVMLLPAGPLPVLLDAECHDAHFGD